MDKTQSAWVEVDLGAVRHNLAVIREAVGGVRVMAVVKANAYGHGLVETSKALVSGGADALAVTRLDEAARLRAAGVSAPVLVFESIQPSAAADAVALDVDLTVCDRELAGAIGAVASASGRTVGVHLKIDTGMGRLGVLPGDAVDVARAITATDGLALAGTYTHFATAAEDDLRASRVQLAAFADAVAAMRSASIDPGIVHAANSAACIRLPESRFDMVRPGTLIYGQYPSSAVPHTLDLKDTWQLKARISFVKSVPAGFRIGYGAEFTTRRPSRIAVIPLGWADGLTLLPESAARRSIARLAVARCLHRPTLSVGLRGTRAPVVGRIAMQMCSVDVTDVPEVRVGDEVVVPCRRVTTNPLLPRVYVG